VQGKPPLPLCLTAGTLMIKYGDKVIEGQWLLYYYYHYYNYSSQKLFQDVSKNGTGLLH